MIKLTLVGLLFQDEQSLVGVEGRARVGEAGVLVGRQHVQKRVAHGLVVRCRRCCTVVGALADRVQVQMALFTMVHGIKTLEKAKVSTSGPLESNIKDNIRGISVTAKEHSSTLDLARRSRKRTKVSGNQVNGTVTARTPGAMEEHTKVSM